MTTRKKFILGSLLVSLGIVACAAFALTANTGAWGILADVAEGPTHTIVLNGANMEVRAYDSGFWGYPLHFHGEKAIGELYDIDTIDEHNGGLTTYAYGAENSFSFGVDDHIAEFTSNGYEFFCFTFFLEDRAVVDLDKSVVDYYVNGTYKNVKLEKFGDFGVPGYFSYDFYFDFTSNYGDAIIIDSMKLVFHC